MTKVYAVIQRTEMAESLISLYESREDAEDNAAKRNILAEGNGFYIKPIELHVVEGLADYCEDKLYWTVIDLTGFCEVEY